MSEQEFDYRESAINFLLYTYFGITLDCSSEDMICAAIIKAYDDATKQGAYTALFRKDITNVGSLKYESDKATKTAAYLLKQKLELLLKCKVEEYDKWHKELCEKIKDSFKNVKFDGKEFFSYGNAQKWVNMTIKYICIFEALCKKDEFHMAINQYYKQFQIPVDSYIIEALWNDEDIDFPEAKKRDRKYKDYNLKGWSCWEREDYEKFTESLGKNIELKTEKSTLNWENKKWIEQSEIRKEKEGKSFDKKKEKFF